MTTSRIDLDAILRDLAPGIAAESARLEETDAFAADAYAALRERGVFAALVPADLGGGGATHEQMCGFLRRLAHACPSTALALSMHQHLVAAAAANHAAGRPGRALLEKVASGAVLVSTGANDWLASNGSSRRVEGGYRISAVKPFASGSPAGHVLITSVAHESPDGTEVLHFPLPLSAEGVSGLDDWRALGMRATGSQTIRIDDAFVPDAAIVLRRPAGPFHPAFAVIVAVALPLIMSVYLGVAERASEIALDAADPDDDVAPPLAGEIATRLASARLAVDAMIRRARDYDFTPDAALADESLTHKALAAEAAIGTVESAMALAGGRGFARKTGLERLWRDVQGASYHPLPGPRQRLFSGRRALGLDPVSGSAPEKTARAA